MKKSFRQHLKCWNLKNSISVRKQVLWLKSVLSIWTGKLFILSVGFGQSCTDPEDILYSFMLFYIWNVCVPFLRDLKRNTSQNILGTNAWQAEEPTLAIHLFHAGKSFKTLASCPNMGQMNSITEEHVIHTFWLFLSTQRYLNQIWNYAF